MKKVIGLLDLFDRRCRGTRVTVKMISSRTEKPSILDEDRGDCACLREDSHYGEKLAKNNANVVDRNEEEQDV